MNRGMRILHATFALVPVVQQPTQHPSEEILRLLFGLLLRLKVIRYNLQKLENGGVRNICIPTFIRS